MSMTHQEIEAANEKRFARKMIAAFVMHGLYASKQNADIGNILDDAGGDASSVYVIAAAFAVNQADALLAALDE